MSGQKIAIILLRLGLAFVFFYAAIASFISPDSWVGFFPIFIRNILPAQFLLIAFSFYELVLGFWLLSGKWAVISAALAAASLLGIVVFNFGVMDIVFRDIGLFIAASALLFLHRKI